MNSKTANRFNLNALIDKSSRTHTKKRSLFVGCFHTGGRTNLLDGQIVWCANGRLKFSTNKSSDIWASIWKYDFSKPTCPSRQTSRRLYDINSCHTNKCQTICPSRQFVHPLMWKCPLMWLWQHVHVKRCCSFQLWSKLEVEGAKQVATMSLDWNVMTLLLASHEMR